jgi:hypothetical protein
MFGLLHPFSAFSPLVPCEIELVKAIPKGGNEMLLVSGLF